MRNTILRWAISFTLLFCYSAMLVLADLRPAAETHAYARGYSIERRVEVHGSRDSHAWHSAFRRLSGPRRECEKEDVPLRCLPRFFFFGIWLPVLFPHVS